MVEQTARCNVVQSFVVCIFDFLLSIERSTRCNYLLLFQICRAFFFCSHISGLMKWWKLRQAHKEILDIPQWEEDYKLSPLPEHYMFWEYLEVGKIERFLFG